MNMKLQIGLYASIFALIAFSPPCHSAGAKSKAILEVEAIGAKYQNEVKGWETKFKSAKTREARVKLFDQTPDASKYSPMMRKILDRHAQDLAGFKSAVWLMLNDKDEQDVSRAIEIIKKYHIKNKELDEFVPYLGFVHEGQFTELLRSYIANRKDPKLVTTAKFGLARLLKEAKQNQEALSLFKQVSRDGKNYPEYKNAPRTMAAASNAFIFELQNLVIGKKAPDIAGEDVFGKKFKLSDYAGKVILLDFFGFW